MSAKMVQVRLLKVTRCRDAQMWYAKMVGEYVPCLGLDHGEWKSRTPSGYSNFIAQDNARVVHVFVSEGKLGDYPYKYAQPTPQTPYVTPPAVTARVKAHVKADVKVDAKAPQSCKSRCDMLGVCRDLPDCEDALGRAQQPKPVQATTGQSHRASAIEAATNIVLGFGVSVGITAALLPAFGHQVTLGQNVAMTSVFTVASFARAYGVRRLFNWLLLRHTTRAGA